MLHFIAFYFKNKRLENNAARFFLSLNDDDNDDD